jgi:hypothetical protein
VRTFKVPFTVALMGVAEVEAETYEDAASLVEDMPLTHDGLEVWVKAMNVETADEEPEGDDA